MLEEAAGPCQLPLEKARPHRGPGAVEAARPIEPLCKRWRIPGIGKNDWSPHAFRLLR
jgi:hypothetical protein